MSDKECKITVIDAKCGKGKTSFAIQYMNEEIFDRFIYITPFISEQDRVVKSCYNREFKKPNEKLGKGSKTNHFYELVKEGYNITSTHSLFKGLSKDIIEEIEKEEYILILDEVMDVVENLDISKYDIQMLLNEKVIEVDSENKVSWIDNEYYGKFLYLKNSIRNGDVYLFDNTLILWCFPCEIFTAFKEVYVLTYMFDGQVQRYYYDLNNLQYEYKSVTKNDDNKYVLCEYVKTNGSEYKDLINIY